MIYEVHNVILNTKRLTVRTAKKKDSGLFLHLWRNPELMKNVGFPEGLDISKREIKRRLEKQNNSAFGNLLVVEKKINTAPIGECMIHKPDSNNIASTDIKLLPEYWGNKYGLEIKRALLEYIFSKTDCDAVEATPNKDNIASIKMQEAVGGIRTGEEVYKFPENLKDTTCAVHHYIYRVTRDSWMKNK